MLKFNSNGEFKILFVADMQDLYFIRPAMTAMLNKACDRESYDLVVLGGDNILGNHICDAPIGKGKAINSPDDEEKAVEAAIKRAVRPFVKRGMTFTAVFGNHDDKCSVSQRQQAKIYKKIPGFVGFNNTTPGVRPDTFNLPIYSADGRKTLFNLWFFDSAFTESDGKTTHEYVSGKSVEWYTEKSKKLKRLNGGKPLPSIAFQHVPFPEIINLVEECSDTDKNKIPMAGNTRDGKTYRVKKNAINGVMGEFPACCSENHGQFEAAKRQGDILAFVFAHDHLNNFTANIDGIKIIQAPGASFRCYGRDRGVWEITIRQSSPADFSSKFISYYELMGNNFSSRMLYLLSADELEGKKNKYLAVLSACAVTAGACTAILAKK